MNTFCQCAISVIKIIKYLTLPAHKYEPDQSEYTEIAPILHWRHCCCSRTDWDLSSPFQSANELLQVQEKIVHIPPVLPTTCEEMRFLSESKVSKAKLLEGQQQRCRAGLQRDQDSPMLSGLHQGILTTIIVSQNLHHPRLYLKQHFWLTFHKMESFKMIIIFQLWHQMFWFTESTCLKI